MVDHRPGDCLCACGPKRACGRVWSSSCARADQRHGSTPPHAVAAINQERSLILLTGGVKYRGESSEGRDELPQFDHIITFFAVEVLVGHDAVLVLLAQVAARLDQSFSTEDAVGRVRLLPHARSE